MANSRARAELRPADFYGLPVSDAPIRKSGWSVVGTLAGGLVVMLAVIAAAVVINGAQEKREEREDAKNRAEERRLSTGVPGYSTLIGVNGKRIKYGEPLGGPCLPVLVRVDANVPDIAYAELVTVVAEARNAGINIAVETRNHAAPPQSGPVQTVSIRAQAEGGAKKANGEPARHSIGYTSRLNLDGETEYLVEVSDTLFLSRIGNSPQAYRQVFRKFVGFTTGVYDTEFERSALSNDDESAADQFSIMDVMAMRMMSGCGGANESDETGVPVLPLPGPPVPAPPAPAPGTVP